MNAQVRPIAILDTNVVSYALKSMSIAFAYSRLLTGYELCISFVTAAELYCGAEKGRWSQRRRIELDVVLQRYPVVPYSEGMALTYAQVFAERERAGRPMRSADAWIAATAIFHNAPLATSDTDFQHTPGLRVITVDQGELQTRPRLRPGARLARPLDASCGCGM